MAQEHHWEMVLYGAPTPHDLCHIMVNFPALRTQASQKLAPLAFRKSYYRRMLLEHGDQSVKEDIANNLLSHPQNNGSQFGWILCDIIRYVQSLRTKALRRLVTLPGYKIFVSILVTSIPDLEQQIAELLSEKSPTYTSIPDEILLSERNAESFAELVGRYNDKLFRTAYKILKNEDAARDALQEAWLKIYQHADLFQKKEKIAASSWLYKVTINTAITHYRKQYHPISDPHEEIQFSREQMPLHQGLDGDEQVTQQIITKVLRAMSADDSKLLIDFYISGISYRELARTLDIPVTAVKMRLFRARERFREMWFLIEDKKTTDKL